MVEPIRNLSTACAHWRPSLTADYTYDGLERLAIRATQNMMPAGTTHYVYDRAGHLIAEATDAGNTVREYVWLDDMPLAVIADVGTATPHLYYVHVDQLNRPIKMTDEAKNVVWDAVYWPFGEVYSIAGSASNNLRFPGQYFLLESGLHYNWYRHYDPTLGRYTQPDPLGFVSESSPIPKEGSIGSRNELLMRDSLADIGFSLKRLQPNAGTQQSDGSSLYAYVKSSPIENTDAQGLSTGPFTPVPPDPDRGDGSNVCRVAMGDAPFCKIVRAACIAECSETSLPSGNFGWKFFNCVNACMSRHGCDPFAAN